MAYGICRTWSSSVRDLAPTVGRSIAMIFGVQQSEVLISVSISLPFSVLRGVPLTTKTIIFVDSQDCAYLEFSVNLQASTSKVPPK